MWAAPVDYGESIPGSIEFVVRAIGNELFGVFRLQGWILPFPLRLEEEGKGIGAVQGLISDKF